MALDKESLLRQQGLGSKKIVSEEIQIVRKKNLF